MRRRLAIWGALWLFPLEIFAQPTLPPTAPPVAAAPIAPPVAAAPTLSTEELLETVGYVVGQQFGMNIGFTDEELGHIVDGLMSAAHGETRPADFEQKVAAAREYFIAKSARYRSEKAETNRKASEAFLTTIEGQEGVQKTESGLLYEIINPGSDKKPSIGDTVAVNYRGTRIDGVEFDSGQGASFPLQTRGGVIDGFKEGLQLIGIGGELKLFIPNELAYGENAPRGGSIQPGDALIFDIELLDIKQGSATPPSLPRTMPSMPPNMRPPGPPPSSPPPAPPPGPPPGTPPSAPKNLNPPTGK